MRISDWSSDVCSSDLDEVPEQADHGREEQHRGHSGGAVVVGADHQADAADDASEGDGLVAGLALHGVELGYGHADDGRDQQHRGRRADVEQDQGEREEGDRSEEHTSELQSLMRISYAVFCLKKKTITGEMNAEANAHKG